MENTNEIISKGFDYHQSGKFIEAEIAYKKALEYNPENAEVCNLLGVLKLQQNDTDAAIDWVKRAITINPSEYYYETLFQAYIRKGTYDAIISCKSDVVSKYPKNFSLLFNIALAYKNLQIYDKAIEYYDKALKIDPSSYQGWFNLAHVYDIEGMGKNAVSAMKICNKIKPNDKDTEYFYSLALMRTKNYNKGLKYFENRICRDMAITLQSKTYPNLASEDKLWRGENIKDKTIYVYYEAGFGDVIMFSRYLPLLKKRCKKIIFYPQRELVPLFANSNLGIDELIEGYIPESELKFDVHAPLLSLPYLLGLKDRNVFYSSEGFLSTDSNMVKDYHEKYFNNDKIKIGIKWRGNTYYDQDRVIPAEMFSTLLNLENTQFYSFQTFEGAEDFSKLKNYNILDLGKDFTNFGQTAAALMNLDLVICNDTSLAHLAGALGVPCYVMLPYDVNWRWHDEFDKCEWYDSLKLYRQDSPGNWESVFSKVKSEVVKGIELSSIVKSKQAELEPVM